MTWYLVVVTGVQLTDILVPITTCTALKDSTGSKLFVQANLMLSLGGVHGASVTIIVTSSTVAISVTLFVKMFSV